MRINRLRIDDFRNLKNFEVSFTVSGTDADGHVQTFNSYAIIGQNGSGKSNLLEVVIAIFRDLDLKNSLNSVIGLNSRCAAMKWLQRQQPEALPP